MKLNINPVLKHIRAVLVRAVLLLTALTVLMGCSKEESESESRRRNRTKNQSQSDEDEEENLIDEDNNDEDNNGKDDYVEDNTDEDNNIIDDYVEDNTDEDNNIIDDYIEDNTDEDNNIIDDYVEDNTDEDDNITDDFDDMDDEVVHHPVYEIENFGNFTEYDPEVFGASENGPEDVLGRWYENGILEGYYLELYGNGTWRYFSDEVISGSYEMWDNGLPDVTESYYGVKPFVFYLFDDEKKPVLSLSIYTPEIIKTRTPDDGNVYFYQEKDSKHCDDLDNYYAEKYPLAYLRGDWFPVGDDSGLNYYTITGAGTWSNVIGHEALDVGRLEDCGDGVFVSEGATFEELTLFELPGDGYLYIDGDAYEQRDFGSAPPSRILGEFQYEESDDGYIFYEDWTFDSRPGSSFDEHGTFMFLGSNLLLYDENGYRVHKFYQDEFMDGEKKGITDFEKDVYGVSLDYIGD